MAARSGPSKSRSVGRYDLVVEMAKSQLGSLWAASVPGSAGLEPRMVRRLAVLSVKNSEALVEAQVAAARWSVDFGVDQALDVLDVVNEPKGLALVSGYVPGETLRALLRLANFKRKDIPPRVALRITLDVCHALLAGETRALAASLAPEQFYGGLLPDSIVVGTDGITRLFDIGVAAVWRTGNNALTHPEVAAYAAPEQFDSKELDSRCDVFILGTLLWEMLSGGKRLFVGSSGKAVADRILNHAAPEVTASHPGKQVPQQLVPMLSKMLERDPRKRFRSVEDLKTSLESLDAEIALPIEVSDFVTTFAHNSLSSRERVLERALNRAVPPVTAGERSASMPKAVEAAQALNPAPGSTPPPPPSLARPSSAGRPSSPPLPALEPTPPSPPARAQKPPAQRSSFAPLPPVEGTPAPASAKLETRAGARPLPLPVHARLGARASAPDGALPPPPPPVVPKNPKAAAGTSDAEEDSSSVRAADILRALAVEDAPPASDEMPTLPPQEPDEASAPSPAQRAAQQTLTGHASPTPPPADRESIRPEMQTLAGGTGNGLQRSGSDKPAADRPAADTATADKPATDEGQTLRAPPDPNVDNARSPDFAEVAAAAAPPGAAAPDVASSFVASSDVERPLAATAAADARASDNAMTGLPARPSHPQSRRLPVPLVAALGGGALLLLIGLVFALGGSESPEPEQEAQVKTASRTPADEPVKAESPPAARQAQPPASAVPPDASATEESAASDNEEETSDQADPPEAKTKEPASTPAARGWSPPATQPAPARKPAPEDKKKLRAKRTFIPSGI